MLKMFSTQLTGLFNRIHEKEEFSFEDGARLLAQAAVGDGHIYLYGKQEMAAILAEAFHSSEPLKTAKPLEGHEHAVTEADRVVIFSRYSDDEEALKVAKWLQERRIPFVTVATKTNDEKECMAALSDVHINLHVTRALLPDEDGNRYGYPASMAALFVYYGLTLTLKEILADY
jgi:D-arabinose 5-phosphate isomerase GutQ